jgi:hypothetical protein
MKFSKRNMTGVSLVEVILALVVAAAIITMGINQYLVYSKDTAAREVTYNVDSIMRAAAYYYYANCEKSSSNSGATLDPANSPPDPYPVFLPALVSSNYLMAFPPQNPLVDSSAPFGGYLVQFNMKTSKRYYCSTPGDSTTCTSQIGNNINYTIQVSVALKDVANATRYYNMTGATCLTSTNLTTIEVEPCSTAASYAATCQAYRNISPSDPNYWAYQIAANAMLCPFLGATYNNYISWERLPSMASPKSQSILWMNNPTVRQFKQMNEAPSLSYMLSNPTATNFLCGS